MQRAQGFVQQGGEVVYTAGIASVTLVQESFPYGMIKVFLTGTTILAALYADNLGTPLPNPFTANAQGYWYFYAANGRYDIMLSSPEMGSWTMGDVLLNDGGGGVGTQQTPWLSNIDGGGFNLTNVGFIDVTGGYLINGVPLSNPNLWVPVPNSSSIYHQGFVGIINQSPAFALDVQGGCNVTDNFYINGVAITAGSGGGGPWVVLGPSQINYAGHVGISNTNPQYSLDVNGSINVSAGNNFFINGVAIGTGGGSSPWVVLAGNRIWYAGQVGIGQSAPTYPLDVLGDVNITGAYRVNGQPIGGGGGQWISGAGGILYYNGGNVGIGTQAPTVALQVTGTVAAGAFALASNPTHPVINSNGAFVGSGVDVTGLPPIAGPSGGIRCIDLTANQAGVAGPISCIQTTGNEGALLAEGAIVSADASAATTGGAPAPGGYYVQPLGQAQILCINQYGQFVGPGINTGVNGISAATISITGQGQPANSTVLSIYGTGGSVADVQVHGSIEIDGQMLAAVYGVTGVGFGLTGTLTGGAGDVTVVNQGLVMSFTPGTGGGSGGGSPTFFGLTVNGASTFNGGITQNGSGVSFIQNGVACITNGIYGGNGVQTTGAVYASVFGIDGFGNGATFTFTTVDGYVVQARGGLVQSVSGGGGLSSLTVSGNAAFNAMTVNTINSSFTINGNVTINNDSLQITGAGEVLATYFGITGVGFGFTGSVVVGGVTLNFNSGLLMSHS